MLRVHHLNNSRSQRVLWLLEELGLDYEIVPYERDKRTMLAPPSLKAIHPLGKSPVLEDAGQVYAETGAIVQLIIDRYGAALAPARDSALWQRMTYWLHYAEGSAMPPLLLKLVIMKMGPLGWPARRFVDGQIRLHLDYLEAELGRAKWFAGDAFTAADIMMSFPIEAAGSRAGLGERPRLQAFLRAIHERPAYQRALARGGPYAYA